MRKNLEKNIGFPGGTSGKEPHANAGDVRDEDSIPGSGRSPGGSHGNPLQYSCLENPMDRGAWWATIHGLAKSRSQLKEPFSDATKKPFRHEAVLLICPNEAVV